MVAGFRAAGVENTEPALVILVVVQVVHKVVFNSKSAAADISGYVAKPYVSTSECSRPVLKHKIQFMKIQCFLMLKQITIIRRIARVREISFEKLCSRPVRQKE